MVNDRIFDEDKMKQTPLYPTKQTPSYADWALFNMGKELEDNTPDISLSNVNVGSENAGKYLTVDADGKITFLDAPSSGGSTDGVTFYDWDGTVLYTYSADEFANLDEMPALPESGTLLTYTRWNWTLANAKTYVNKYGMLNIGAQVMPTDGKNHLYVLVPDGYEMVLTGTADETKTVNWGDGTSDSNLTHTYVTGGYYHIVCEDNVTSVDGTSSVNRTDVIFAVLNNDIGLSYQVKLMLVTIAESITSIRNDSFRACFALKSIIIPKSITSIGNTAFYYCYSMKSLSISEDVATFGSECFEYCALLKSVTIPESVTIVNSSCFRYCYALESITIPESVTTIGTSAFNNCYALESITIPESVRTLGGSVFTNCHLLKLKITSSSTSLTNISYKLMLLDLTELETVPSTNPSTTNSLIYVKPSMLQAFKDAWTTIANQIVASPLPPDKP